MNLRHNPIPFILNAGDDATILSCLEFFDLLHLPIARDCIEAIKKRRLETGAFPSQLNPDQWGMKETIRNTLLLLQIGGFEENGDLDKSLEFILGHQNPDGGWSENSELTIPAEFVELSNQKSITWLTGDAVEILRLAEREEGPFNKAVDFLRKSQNEDGGWHCYSGSIGYKKKTPGDPDSTGQIAFLFSEIFGESDPAYISGRALYERFLDELSNDVEQGYRHKLQDDAKVELDVYTLTSPFLSSLVDQPRRILSGFDIGDPRVRRIMDELVGIQRPDGGWRPFWSDVSSPVYTVIAIKTLVLTGMLRIEDLIVDLRAYIGWKNLYQRLCGDEG